MSAVLRLFGFEPGSGRDRATEQAEVRRRLREQERRVQALDRAVEVIQRSLAEERRVEP